MGSNLSCDITKFQFFVSHQNSTFRASASKALYGLRQSPQLFNKMHRNTHDKRSRPKGDHGAYLSISVFTQGKYSDSKHINSHNSVRWYLSTNSFHQYARLLTEISPHTLFLKKIFRSDGEMCVSVTSSQKISQKN